MKFKVHVSYGVDGEQTQFIKIRKEAEQFNSRRKRIW